VTIIAASPRVVLNVPRMETKKHTLILVKNHLEDQKIGL